MSDLISRQAAIDAIGEKSDEIYKTKQKGATYPHDDFFQGMAYAENVIKQLPSAQPEQRWIPCSVQLPEDDTEVLVYLFENNKSLYIAWLSDGRWYTEYFEVEREDEPVAWMPLPEPARLENGR